MQRPVKATDEVRQEVAEIVPHGRCPPWPCSVCPKLGHALVGSPVKGNTDRRAIHAQTRAVFGEVVVEVPPHAEHLAPVERVPKSCYRLPSELGCPGTNVEVVRHKPRVLIAKHQSAFG